MNTDSSQKAPVESPRLSEEAQFAVDALGRARAGCFISREEFAAILNRSTKWIDRARADGTIPEADGARLKSGAVSDRRAVSWRGGTVARFVDGQAGARRRRGAA